MEADVRRRTAIDFSREKHRVLPGKNSRRGGYHANIPLFVLLALSLFGVGSLVSGPARADNLLIQNQLSKWKLGSSPAANPLPVEVRKGDVIEFKVTGPHGIVTIDKPGDQMPAPALDLVLSCGEDPGSKPNAVLRELECGAASKFNKVLTSPMKLEVTEKFQGDIHFWCIVHKQGMWGTLKLKTKTAAEPRFVRQSLAEFVKDPQKLATLIRGINEMKRRSAAPPASAEYRTSWEYWANMHGYPGPNGRPGPLNRSAGPARHGFRRMRRSMPASTPASGTSHRPTRLPRRYGPPARIPGRARPPCIFSRGTGCISSSSSVS